MLNESEFDTDTALERAAEGVWEGRITDRWSIGTGPNGGYLAAIIARAATEASPFDQPLAMNVHYVERPAPGPVSVEVDTVRVGRSHATVAVRLVQDQPVAVALATLGRHRSDEAELVTEVAPEYPPPASCAPPPRQPVPPGGMSFRDRFETKVSDPSDLFHGSQTAGPPVTRGWTRLADGRRTDNLVVPLLMDSFPPAIFSALPRPPAGAAGGPGAPTIELTVHWRRSPQTAWHLAVFRTRFLTSGYVEEDGELWDEDGRLVAQSRQLARVRTG